MTQDEVIELARQAKLMCKYDESSPWGEGHEITEYVVTFAKLVTAKERDECAKRAAIALIGSLKTKGVIVLKAILARGEH